MTEKVVVSIYRANRGHPFLKDFENKLRQTIEVKDESHIDGYIIRLSSEEKERYIKEWYGYEAEIQPYNTHIVLYMTEQEHTLFALKYAS